MITRLKRLRSNSMRSNPKKHVFLGWLRILLGLIIYSFGVHLTIAANIGLAPWDCLGMGIAKHTPLNYGSSMVLIGISAILLQILMRERIGFSTIFDALLTGNLVQLFNDITPYPENSSTLIGIALMFSGFLFISFGMWVYMRAEQGCGPKDGLLIAIGKRLPKIPIGIVEVLLWSVVTLLGWLLGGSVGIGTLLSTFGAGTIMHLLYSTIGFEPRKLKHKSLTETVKLLSGR
ncbi:YitT family protein [Ruminococcus flavefaciens]|uniref:YczE/YyaS/YitT family protein n=1 Tax=Ruminococcus flavefaciens TaxID=1265 RepID=UPI0026F013C3|nr:hypothetical protein [Ruminococcus flavefaciens]